MSQMFEKAEECSRTIASTKVAFVKVMSRQCGAKIKT